MYTVLLCKENLAFNKMSSLCELEEKHDVDLGSGYKNKQACMYYIHRIYSYSYCWLIM